MMVVCTELELTFLSAKGGAAHPNWAPLDAPASLPVILNAPTSQFPPNGPLKLPALHQDTRGTGQDLHPQLHPQTPGHTVLCLLTQTPVPTSPDPHSQTLD